MPLHERLAIPLLATLAWAPAALAKPAPRSPPQSQPIQMEDETEEEEECPPAVRGVQLSLTPITSGVRFDFTTARKDQVSDLRDLLREAAATMEYHSKLVALHPDLVTAEDEVIPPVDIEVADLPTGVQVTIRAENPTDGKQVVAHARKLEQAWDTNDCVRSAAAAQRTALPRRLSR